MQKQGCLSIICELPRVAAGGYHLRQRTSQPKRDFQNIHFRYVGGGYSSPFVQAEVPLHFKTGFSSRTDICSKTNKSILSS